MQSARLPPGFKAEDDSLLVSDDLDGALCRVSHGS